MNHTTTSRTNQPSFITPDGYTSDIAVFTIDLHYPKEHKPPAPTLKILLIKRAEVNLEGEPNIEAGKWALPGVSSGQRDGGGSGDPRTEGGGRGRSHPSKAFCRVRCAGS